MGSHVRSASSPSETHPLIQSVEDQLSRLRSSSFEATSTSSSSMCNKLVGLKELYERVDDLLQLPLNQTKYVEEGLNGSLVLLDFCSIIMDVLSQTKSSVQQLQSSFRRTRVGKSILVNEVGEYLMSRKRLGKVINKSFGNLKKIERKMSNKECDQKETVFGMLRGVEEISVKVFESLLCFVSQPKAKSRSLVYKIVHSTPVLHEKSEVEKIENEILIVLNGKKTRKDINIEQHVLNVLKGLEAFELSIKEVEEEMECVFRRLLKNRVSLLNVLKH